MHSSRVMISYWRPRSPFRCTGLGLLSQCNSTVACHRRIAVSLSRPREVSTPHFMGTWTDKFKRRWQSGGDQSQDTTNKSEHSPPETQSKPEDSESEPVCAELQQTLIEKDALIKANEEKMKDLRDKYLRALAEAENTRTRLTRQIEDAKRFGIQDFSKDVLEVGDILDKAIESVKPQDLKDNSPLVALFEGLKMTEAELRKVLNKNGLQKINDHGVDFDPNIHEALFEVPGDKHGTVAVVSRVGYLLHGRTIRPARVGVVKAPDS